MTDAEILKTLTSIFHRTFDDDSIVLTTASTATDIEEWDSLNQIKIILACEREFGVPLNARKINSLENVGEMVAYIQTEFAQR